MGESQPDQSVGVLAGEISKLGAEIRCPNCNKPVDPLRADRVAIFEWQFHYFCSAECHAEFVRARAVTEAQATSDHVARAPSIEDPPIAVEIAPSKLERDADTANALETDELFDAHDQNAIAPPTANEPEDTAVSSSSTERPSLNQYERSQTWLVVSLGLATLGTAGLQVSPATWLLYAAAIIALLAVSALVWAERHRATSLLELGPLTAFTAPIGSALLLGLAVIAHHPLSKTLADFSLVLIAVSAGSSWLIRRERRPSDLKLENFMEMLSEPSYRVDEGRPLRVEARELHPGHEIVTEAGATLAVDAQIIAGQASVAPWFESSREENRTEGEPLVAGAKIISGRVRAIVSWAGDDRAFIRLIAASARSAELHAAFARLGWFTATRMGWALAAIFALGALTVDGSAFEYLALAFAAQACLANPAVRQGAALQARRIAFQLIKHGIAFRDAAALDKAGRVSTAALCARGTVLLGEPEVASIETLGPHSVEEILALAAGAETAATHPSAIAVRRAARTRNIVPDASRSPDYTPGLGVTAVSANGKPLIVGNRALMLKHRVGVAVAEKRIVELESTGRSVLLVALESHLIGVIGLQDGLRPGARAAVQHLIDVGIEPVLLSGDARETCEALGRAVDIYHIRPEVLPTDRGKEIRRLADGGATVAVIGRSPTDDMALAAADVSVVLAAAGSTSAEWSTELASDSIRDAAYALRLAHFARRETRLALVVPISIGLLGLLAAVISTKLVLCPLAAGTGAILFLARYRTTLPPGATAERASARAPLGLGG